MSGAHAHWSDRCTNVSMNGGMRGVAEITIRILIHDICACHNLVCVSCLLGFSR